MFFQSVNMTSRPFLSSLSENIIQLQIYLNKLIAKRHFNIKKRFQEHMLCSWIEKQNEK